jgi:arylsulfatase A
LLKQVNALDEVGLGRNTILVFASDNGPEIEAYERARSVGHFSMAHFRGVKRDLYEGGHRIPMVVRWPAKVAPGTTSDSLFSLTDW